MANGNNSKKPRVGLVVAFATLGAEEEDAVKLTWATALDTFSEWEPAFSAYGLDPVANAAREADILVYLGESSRFEAVAGKASLDTPVILVKSTVEELLNVPPGGAPRYRMCTGVHGIARALAAAAPQAPTVDWKTLPWPEELKRLLELDPAEQSYVDTSIGAFREAARARGIEWVTGLPNGPFSVFLTMHDPTAARLAVTALRLWPECTVIAADGMTSTSTPGGEPWPEQLIRVRHWSSRVNSQSNSLFGQALGGQDLPDFDSAGMVFGTLAYLEGVFTEGGAATQLEAAGSHEGPLGPMEMTASGQPDPERIIVFRGEQLEVHEVE